MNVGWMHDTKKCAAVCGREGVVKGKGTPHWWCRTCAKAYKVVSASHG